MARFTDIPVRRRRAAARGRSSFVLMEVLLALAILVLGLTVIGSQFQSSWAASRTTERFYTAMLLAESKLAELDTGLIQPEDLIEEDWGELFPEYAWRMTVEPSAVQDLWFITLEILYDPARRDTESQFEFDDADVAFTTHIMRATPERVDLTRDFGMSEAQADELAGELSGVGEFGLDPRDLDPAVFRDLDLAELIEVLPPLLQAFGMSIDDVMNVLPPELRTAFEEALQEAEDAEDETGETGESGTGESATEAGDRDAEAAPDEGEEADADRDADENANDNVDKEDQDTDQPDRTRRPGRSGSRRSNREGRR